VTQQGCDLTIIHVQIHVVHRQLSFRLYLELLNNKHNKTHTYVSNNIDKSLKQKLRKNKYMLSYKLAITKTSVKCTEHWLTIFVIISIILQAWKLQSFYYISSVYKQFIFFRGCLESRLTFLRLRIWIPTFKCCGSGSKYSTFSDWSVNPLLSKWSVLPYSIKPPLA